MKRILAVFLLVGMLFTALPTLAAEPDPSHTHSYFWVIDREATCGQAGIKHEECLCGEKRNENTAIATTPHSLSATAAKSATCTAAGNIAYWHCSVCGKYFSDAKGKNEVSSGSVTIAASGHNFGDNWIVEKATSAGEKDKEYQKCLVCGAIGEVRYTDSQSTGSHTHKLTSYAAKSATCTAAGNKAYWYCSGCGKYFSDANGKTEISAGSVTVAAAGHSYKWVTDKEATATQAGSKHEECTVCGAKRNENTVIPAEGNTTESTASTVPAEHNHVIKELKAKEATCESEGNKACWYCAGCNKYYSDAQGKKELQKSAVIIPKTEHTLVWVEDIPATAESTGIKHEECTACGLIQSENTVIPLVGHVHNLIRVEAREASCSEEGNEEYYICSECSLVFLDADGTEESTLENVTVPMTEHTPITDENGNEVCAVCGAAITEEMTETPKMLRGANQSWDKSESLGTTFATNIVPSSFRRVLVDGQPLNDTDYKKRGTKLEVTLEPSFLLTLSEGQHTVIIEAGEGEVVAFFNITDRSSQKGIDPWLIAVIAAVAALIPLTWLTVRVLKKRRQSKGETDSDQDEPEEVKPEKKA